MRTKSKLITILLAIFSFQPAMAEVKQDTPRRFAIGNIGLACATLPCSSRGITELEGTQTVRILWSNDLPPRFTGTPDDTILVSSAWEAEDCLIVEGNFGDQGFYVDRVVGSCN